MDVSILREDEEEYEMEEKLENKKAENEKDIENFLSDTIEIIDKETLFDDSRDLNEEATLKLLYEPDVEEAENMEEKAKN
jgi:hypothetical protein